MSGITTNTTIVSIHNTYPGLNQVETVVAYVTNSLGVPINQGVVSFQLAGLTIVAPVVNGFASATFIIPMLDFAFLLDLFLAHSLTAGYNDFGNNNFLLPSGTGTTVPAILLDFFLTQFAGQLTQFQTP